MLNIVIQISAYLILAITLGYFFGWLVTKIQIKSLYQGKLEHFIAENQKPEEETLTLKDDIYHLRRENKKLKEEKQKVNSMYEGQKYVLDEHNAVLDDFQRRLLKKDEVIEELSKKLSLLEERQAGLDKKHEEEIDAFVFERIELTQKYKELMDKYRLLQGKPPIYKNGVSKNSFTWLSRLFLPASKVD